LGSYFISKFHVIWPYIKLGLVVTILEAIFIKFYLIIIFVRFFIMGSLGSMEWAGTWARAWTWTEIRRSIETVVPRVATGISGI
jgi:hypothetical protein